MDAFSPLTPTEKREIGDLVTAGAQRTSARERSVPRLIAIVAGLVLIGGIAGGVIAAATLNTPTTGLRPAATPSDEPPSIPPSSPPYELSDIKAFARPSTPADALPASLPAYALEDLLPETSRYVGMHGTVDYYVVQGRTESKFCLVVYDTQHADGWSAACGGGLPVSTGIPGLGIDARLDAVGRTPQGWVALDENVSVNPAP